MKNKYLINILTIFMCLLLVGCGKDKNLNNKANDNSNSAETNETINNDEDDINNNNDSNTSDDVIEDDEIIDFEDEENPPISNERVTVENVINCDGCVFAYFSGEGENAKKLGDTITNDEYTTDVNNIRTSGNKQRHNFFGLVLSGNTISKAYSCILKDSKIYCIQGSTDGTYHQNNIGILNQIFTADQCKTLSEGHNYWCSDGSYNGNSKTNGYTALHYETSCTIYGADSNTGKLICH